MNKYRRPYIVILVIVILNITEVLNQKVNAKHTLTSFNNIRKLYPKLSLEAESRNWLFPPNDDNFNKHPCKRECIAQQHMTCYYKMILHHDETMGPACVRYIIPKNRYKFNKKEYINSSNIYGSNGNGDFDYCKYADGVRTEVMVVNGLLPGE
ncbi:hypothetical protein CVS40_12044 [Lucilia cuprina]|nr:hypothetical protein CVS40_12044 [Lucilia cuprina]